jgi:dTDP-glucose 4,6-dehydratase
MNILITGGAGFIGSNFIRYLVKKYPHYRICNLDKLTYAGNLDNLRGIPHNHKFVFGDICNKQLVEDIMRHTDVIVHFAAESHVDRSINDSSVFTRTNVAGTHILLEAARRFKIKRFIHISTDEVYGSIARGSFKETDPLKPNSPYSASKAAADLLARSYFVTYNLPVVITRSSNNFGPYQHPEKLIPLFITNMLENKKVPLYGDGKNIRDWLYVKDNCEAIDFILHHGVAGEIYNIAANNEKSNIEITRLLLKELGKDKSFIQYVKDRPGHDRRYSLNCEKIYKLGWRPKSRFKSALQETILWYKSNEKWWRKLKH